jgi:hypothetical protein
VGLLTGSVLAIKNPLAHPKADAAKRSLFKDKMNNYQSDGRDIVYLDESGFAHDMPRMHGYAPRGQRCYGKQAWGARGRTNAIGALLGSCLLTVTLFQNNIDTSIFKAWLLQDLLPKLPARSIIVMDNAAFHKALPIKIMMEASGHTLEYLPSYSPDYPIEHKWAQAKAMRRAFSCSLDELFQCPFL